MELTLLVGGRKVNQAMRAGIARHAKLEEEVVSYLVYFIFIQLLTLHAPLLLLMLLCKHFQKKKKEICFSLKLLRLSF